MRYKVLLICFVALLIGFVPVNATELRTHSEYSGFPGGVIIQNVPILNTYGGDVFWVDTVAGSDGNKGTFQRPWKTLDYAVGRCAANNGDIIMIKSGSAISVGSPGALDLDVEGITIIGIGNMDDRPTITSGTTNGADIDVDADNITLSNVIIDLTGVDSIDAGIDVNAANFTLRDVEIIQYDAWGQADTAIILDANSGGFIMENVKISGVTTSTGSLSGVSIYNGTNTAAAGYTIINSEIIGDYTNACIYSAATPTHLNISYNYLRNYQSGDYAIELTSTASGRISHNEVVVDTPSAAIDPGSCQTFGNSVYDSDLTDAIAVQYLGSGGAISVKKSGASGIATANLFQVENGPIRIIELIGVVTVTIEAAANSLKLLVDPVEPATDTDLCAAADVTGDAAGTVFSLARYPSDPLIESTNGVIRSGATLTAGAGAVGQTPIICPAGMIEVNGTASTAGTVDWYLRYEPLDNDVIVTAQ